MTRFGRPNVDGVETAWTERVQAAVACSRCDWARPPAPGASWPRIRMAAHRHVAATGHPVVATSTTAYGYRRTLTLGPAAGRP